MISKRTEKQFSDNEALAKDAKHRRSILLAAKEHELTEIERIKKEKLLGTLVSVSDVTEAFLEIGATTKSQLARFASTLPPKLEGLAAASMIPIIQAAVDEVLLNLSTSFELTAPAPEPVTEERQPLEETQLE